MRRKTKLAVAAALFWPLIVVEVVATRVAAKMFKDAVEEAKR